MSRKPSLAGRLWSLCSQLNPFSPLRPRCVGIDEMGNKYMMKPANPDKGIKKETRWIIPSKRTVKSFEDNLGMGISVEWNAWLRHTRKDPPTEEEMETNEIKKYTILERAKELEHKVEEEKRKAEMSETRDGISENIKGNTAKKPFPVYKEYET